MADELIGMTYAGGLTSHPVHPFPLSENNSPHPTEQNILHIKSSSGNPAAVDSKLFSSEVEPAIDLSLEQRSTKETLPGMSVVNEEECVTGVQLPEMEAASGDTKKQVIFGAVDPLPPTDITPIILRAFRPSTKFASAASDPHGGAMATEGLPHRRHQPPGAPHRSFAALSMTMVGLGRSGKARGAAQKVVPELRTVDSTLVYKILRPFFWAMRISGIFFIRRRGELDVTSTGCCSRRFAGCLRKMPAKSETYSCVVCALLAANLLRSFSAFDQVTGFNQSFSFKLTWMALWFEGFSRVLLSLIFWHRRKGGFQEFLINLDSLFFTDGIIPYENALSKMMTIFLVVTCVLLSITVALFGYGIFSRNPDLLGVYDVALTPYEYYPEVPVPLDVFLRVSILLLFTWNVVVCFLFIGFFSIVCYLLYKEFEYLCRTFKLKITEDGRFTDDLERFRVTHQSRCKMVENVDGLFKHFIANTYLVEIPVFCLLTYTLLLPDQTPVAMAMEAFWMIFVAGQTILVSIASIAVNTQAHSILPFIYSITASNASTERQLEINMFLNKLTGTSVGLTAWDMFDINKPAMLTIMGLLLSFFFLLMQFNNPLQNIPSAQCDCPIDPSTINNTFFNITNSTNDSNVVDQTFNSIFYV